MAFAKALLFVFLCLVSVAARADDFPDPCPNGSDGTYACNYVRMNDDVVRQPSGSTLDLLESDAIFPRFNKYVMQETWVWVKCDSDNVEISFLVNGEQVGDSKRAGRAEGTYYFKPIWGMNSFGTTMKTAKIKFKGNCTVSGAAMSVLNPGYNQP